MRFRGGATQSLDLPLPLNAWQLRQTDPAVMALIDALLEDHTDREIVQILNARGLKPGQAEKFSRLILFKLRQGHNLPDRFSRLRQRGLLTQEELSARLGVSLATVQCWRRAGLLAAHRYNDKGGHLYEAGDGAPRKQQGKPLRIRRAQFHPQRANEVQCSA